MDNLRNLKECYELALMYDQEDVSQKMIRDRYSVLENEPVGPAWTGSQVMPDSWMKRVSEITSALSKEQFGSSSDSFNYWYWLQNLPECGEKYYLYAIVTLKFSTVETARVNAMSYITTALKLSPHDPRIIALRDILINVR